MPMIAKIVQTAKQTVKAIVLIANAVFCPCGLPSNAFGIAMLLVRITRISKHKRPVADCFC